MTSSTTTQSGEVLGSSGEASGVRGLLDRDDLLQTLDRAMAKRVTVISAPPGSGKTSLLRAWAYRSATSRRVAFVSVEREQEDGQLFWSAVLDAIRSSGSPIDPETQLAPTPELEGDQVVERIVAELAEQARFRACSFGPRSSTG
jgi:LuxR family transcriptional regulator, maltose regulon positive regulatory protein